MRRINIKTKRYIKRWIAAVLLLATIAAAVVVAWNIRPDHPYLNALLRDTKYFSFYDQIIMRDPSLPLNPYDKGSFSMSEDRMTYLADNYYIRNGIDVSSYQGKIDWTSVAEDGIDFAFVRVGIRGSTEGGLYADSRYEANIDGAQQAGIETGVYIFSQAINAEEGREEAEFVLSLLDGRELQMPVVFDWEYVGEDARTYDIPKEQLGEACNAFCSAITEAGYTPLVYFNCYTAYLCYELSDIIQYDFWLAQYTDYPTFQYDFDYWQYSCTGNVAGIDGDVDLNLQFIEQ